MKKPESSKLPKHVAIIMDGNGRWAKRRSMPRFLGHRQGVNSLKKAVRYASNLGIAVLTVYAFSTENWQRPLEEINFLLELMAKTFDQEIDELEREKVRIILIGDRTTLSPEILKIWTRAEERTAHNNGLTLNIAFNYGSRQELTSAFRHLAQQVANGELSPESITEQNVSDLLYTRQCPDPDLIIRSGGEFRLSNFLLWQAAYSELYITDVLWPDFDEQEFAKALQAFQQRERRFGKVATKERN